MSLEQLVNSGTTTTTGSVNNSSNPVTVAVTDASVFPSVGNFRIIIDSEILLVTAVSGNNLTATRAQENTTIASHSSGANVKFTLTKQSLQNVIGEYNLFDLYSNIPSAGQKGRKFTMSPGMGAHYVDNGSTWDLWCRDYGPMNPNLSDFTTHINFASRGSVDTSKGIFQLKDAGPSTNGDQLLLCLKSTPGTPWTMTLCWRENLNNDAHSGIAIRDSSTGRIKTFSLRLRDFNFYAYNFNSATSSNANILNASFGPSSRDLCMLRLTNTGTVLNFYYSTNFSDWYRVYHENVASNFIATIDQVGFFLNPISSDESNVTPESIDVFHAVCA